MPPIDRFESCHRIFKSERNGGLICLAKIRGVPERVSLWDIRTSVVFTRARIT